MILEIRSLSPEDQLRVRQALKMPATAVDACQPRESADVEYQESLVKAGLLQAVKPRLRDQEAFDRFKPIEVSGKPLSETIIEERR